MTKDYFLKRASAIWGDLYDYTLLPDNFLSHTNIPVICKKHGKFNQLASHHLSKHGCKECAKESNRNKFIESLEDFIRKATLVWGDTYDYSKSIYKGARVKLIIICKKHGEFSTTPDSHIHKHGCPICGVDIVKTKRWSSYDTSKFVNNAVELWGERYTYNNSIYTKALQPIIVTCRIHGDWETSPGNFLAGYGCPKCKSSKGNLIIDKWLKDNGIFYKREYRFTECRDKKPLPFDFAVFSDEDYRTLVYLIEYDGEQHYIPVMPRGGISALALTKNHDIIKDNYTIVNKIPLLRIPYWNKDNIGVILHRYNSKFNA